MINVVSFSGGRTSAHLVYLMEKMRINSGIQVKYLFMDTGAEHPKTYKFIRELVANWGIELICLRVKINPELGKANSYEVIPVSKIGPDLKPWMEITKKYGTPYFGGAFCTRTMKIEVCERYCKENFQESESWLGMRIDEPARIWGEKLHPLLRRLGFHNEEMMSLYAQLRGNGTQEEMVKFLEEMFLLDTANAGRVSERVIKIRKTKQRFMGEICNLEKQDILNWWKTQPFDLEIDEHLGNCVFCIKKGPNKIALALRDEPELAAAFKSVILSAEVRVVERRQQENKIMYRNSQSLEDIELLYANHTRDEIAATIRGSKAFDSGSCSESCEAFAVDSAQMDLFTAKGLAA